MRSYGELPLGIPGRADAIPDENGNFNAPNFNIGFLPVVAAADTTILTAASPGYIYVTGSTTQTIRLPNTRSLKLGQQWMIVNKSTGLVTVQASQTSTVNILAASTTMLVTVISLTSTTPAGWRFEYFGFLVGSQFKLSVQVGILVFTDAAGTDFSYTLSNFVDTSVAGTQTLTGTLATNGNLILSGTTSVLRTKGYTVATLPAGTNGDRAHVTDGAAGQAFGAAIAAGGAVLYPVYYDGAWKVG